MRIFRFACLSAVLAILTTGLACSSSDAPGASLADAGLDSAEPARDTGAEDAVADAARAEASVLPPITGTLDVRTAGAAVTTVKTGPFAPRSGSAQWRARPSGGGVLTVRLDEDPMLAPARSIELTLYDDAGTLDPNESFIADAPGGFALHKARVETYQGSAGWKTEGDGSISVLAFDPAFVKLELKNVGQFTQETAGPDTFVIEGTVTVPLATFASTASGTASVALSNLQNEPIGGEAPNVSSPAQPLTSSTSSLDDLAYPFTSKRRAVSFVSAAGGIARNLRIAFPSGHLPRAGRAADLSKFDRVQVTYFEGATLGEAMAEPVWEADKGALTVETLTATSLTLRLQAAGMQSESPTAKGTFVLDGTVTVQLPPAL